MIVNTKNVTDMSGVIEKFSDMGEKSRTSDGDRQGDGWGASWIESDGEWKKIVSLNPIWEDRDRFSEIPETTLLVIHARSATYEDTIGDISFNQPFIDGEYAYVFNGHIRGVKINEEVDGRIGSEKTWSLIQKRMKKESPQESLREVYELIKNNSKRIFGMNISVVSRDNVYLISTTTQDDDYFTLWKAKSNDILIICSEPIEGYEFGKLSKDEVLQYTLD